MTIRALLLTLIFAAPLAAQTMAFDPGTGESWVIRDAQMPFHCVRMPADGVSTTPRAQLPMQRKLSVPEAVAAKAINGHFGPLPEWKRVGYQSILDNGTVKQTAWITNYWTVEPGVGTICASGRKVEAGRTAAMLHSSGRRLKSGEFGYFVLIELPRGHELRQVWDTGSPKNKSRAKRLGATTWIDRYVTRRNGRTWVAPIYIAPGRKR